MDKFNESLTAAECKSNDLKKTQSESQDRSSSLLLFSLRWKDLEEHYESLRNELSQREKKVCALEESLQCRSHCFDERCREFEVKAKDWRKKIEERGREFVDRARLGFEAKGREIEGKVEGLESMRREIVERLEEIEQRERRVERVFKDRDREVGKKEKKLEKLWKKIETRKKQIHCRDGELKNKKKGLEDLRRKIKSREIKVARRFRKLENKEKELEVLEKKTKMREEEIGVKFRKYEEDGVKSDERLQEAEKREREGKIWYEKQFELLEIRRKEVAEKIGKVIFDEEKLKERSEEIESQERKLDKRAEELDLKEKRLKEFDEKLKSGKRELEEKAKEADLKEQSLKERLDNFALEKGEFDKRFEEGIVWERRWLQGIKELKIREEQLEQQEERLEEQNRKINVAKNSLNMAVLAVLSSEEPCNREVDTATGVVVQHCVVMDGKAFQIFLNEHGKENDKMRYMVSALLRFCSDPAKLVLDAIVGFYPPHLKHGDHEFEVSVVRSSCLLLLEELMEISPKIKPHVKGEAMKLSFDWIIKMNVDLERSIEVVAFLELVCAYGLADAFDANELLDYAENVAHHRQIPKLCRALGLAGKIPGLIQTLLRREQHLIALGFIVEFDLIDEFPPASLLDDFIKLSENAAEVIIREGNNSIEAQNRAITQRIAMLKDVVKCIEYHDIRSGFSAGSIERMIDSLKQKASLDIAISPIGSGLQTTESNHSDHNDPPAADAASDLADIASFAGSAPRTEVTTVAAAPLTISIQQQEDMLMEALPNPNVGANKSVCSLECLPQVDTTADKGSSSCKLQHFSVNVKDFRVLLGENVAYDLVRDEILCVLKSSSCPAQLVLDAMKNDPPKLIEIPTTNCILLLEDLKKLSPVIEFSVEAEARQYAKDWISKLEQKKDDHMEVICFMQFLLVYNLCRDFEELKVYALMDPSCWLNKFIDSCQLLGIPDLLPNFVENLIANKCLLKAIGYIHTFKLVNEFPPDSLLNNYMMNAMKEADLMFEGENVSPADQIMAMDCKISAVRAAVRYVQCYGIGSKDMHIRLQDDLEQLEKQKTERTQKLDAVSSACERQDDVKTLRMLLNRDTGYESVKDEIFRVLKSSPEPAYLVLKTIKNVDSSHLEGYIQFELGFPIKNCILLLEQLQGISPKIESQARDEAGSLLKRWIKKLKQTKDDHMGVLCFIMLHVVYSRSTGIYSQDVITLLNPSGWKQVSESCRKLGLKNVYPEYFICKLTTRKKKWIKAIKYIRGFGLEDKFPIATLLKDYLFRSRRNADNMRGGKKRSPEALVQAIEMKIDAAKTVVRYIQQHNLYSVYPVQALQDEIEQLYEQKDKACQHYGSSRRGSKRNRKHRDAEDEKFMRATCSVETFVQKKEKSDLLGWSQRCSISYDPMQHSLLPPLPPEPPTPTPPPPLPIPTSQQCFISYDPMQSTLQPPLPPEPPTPTPPPPFPTSQQCFISYDPMQSTPQPPLPQLPTPSRLLPGPLPPVPPLPTSAPAMPPPYPHPHHSPQPHPHPYPESHMNGSPAPLLPTSAPAPLPPYPYPHPHPHAESHMNGSNWHHVTPHYNIPSRQYASSPGYPPVYPHPPHFCEYGGNPC